MMKTSTTPLRTMGIARFGVASALALAATLHSGWAHAGSSLTWDTFEDPTSWQYLASGTTGGAGWNADPGALSPTHDGLIYMSANAPSANWVLMQKPMQGVPRATYTQTSCTATAEIKSLGNSTTRARGKLEILNPANLAYIAIQPFNFAPDGVWHLVKTTGNCNNSFVGPNNEFFGGLVRIVIDAGDTAGALSYFAVDNASFSITYPSP